MKKKIQHAAELLRSMTTQKELCDWAETNLNIVFSSQRRQWAMFGACLKEIGVDFELMDWK